MRQLPFSSTLQRMTVIGRALNGSHFSVYTKGSPEMIESLCRKETRAFPSPLPVIFAFFSSFFYPNNW